MPSVGLKARVEPVNFTTSPILEWVNIHCASAGAMLVHPWDTFAVPWADVDHGAEWMNSPVQVRRMFHLVWIL